MGTPRSAKNAKVRFNSIVFNSKKWTVTPKTDKLDTSNSESAGYGDWISGFVYCEFTVEGDADAVLNPYDTAPSPGLQAGAALTNVKLYLNDTTGPYWSFPAAGVLEAPMTGDVKQTLGISVHCEGRGIFVYPTGVF